MSRFDTIADQFVDPGAYEPRKLYNSVLKRLIDFIFALILLVVLFPVLIVIAIIVKLESPGPVFYCGIRTGYRGKAFRILKFRSMEKNAELLGGGTTANNDRRITRVGRFLRKTKLDEIPQLFNIIIGDMSFIGPRPELPKYTALHERETLQQYVAILYTRRKLREGFQYQDYKLAQEQYRILSMNRKLSLSDMLFFFGTKNSYIRGFINKVRRIKKGIWSFSDQSS